MVQLQGASMLAMSCISLSQQDEPIQSEEAPSSWTKSLCQARSYPQTALVFAAGSPKDLCHRSWKGALPSKARPRGASHSWTVLLETAAIT